MPAGGSASVVSALRAGLGDAQTARILTAFAASVTAAEAAAVFNASDAAMAARLAAAFVEAAAAQDPALPAPRFAGDSGLLGRAYEDEEEEAEAAGEGRSVGPAQAGLTASTGTLAVLLPAAGAHRWEVDLLPPWLAEDLRREREAAAALEADLQEAIRQPTDLQLQLQEGEGGWHPEGEAEEGGEASGQRGLFSSDHAASLHSTAAAGFGVGAAFDGSGALWRSGYWQEQLDAGAGGFDAHGGAGYTEGGRGLGAAEPAAAQEAEGGEEDEAALLAQAASLIASARCSHMQLDAMLASALE